MCPNGHTISGDWSEKSKGQKDPCDIEWVPFDEGGFCDLCESRGPFFKSAELGAKYCKFHLTEWLRLNCPSKLPEEEE